MRIPLLYADGYKIGHKHQYPDDLEFVYSNLTPRSTRRQYLPGEPQGIVFLGLQPYCLERLVEDWNRMFFQRSRYRVLEAYKRRVENYLGHAVDASHVGALHDLGHLPILIKALPEGSFIPYGVPALTIQNTHDEFGWIVNAVETDMSAELWGPSTSATTALGFRRVFEGYAKLTGTDPAFVDFQGHDFSARGMFGMEAAARSALGHSLFFKGTDTLPVLDLIEECYGGDPTKEPIGYSVDATEHSVMCVGSAVSSELETFRRLLTEVSPKGILSVVSDTWDLWRVLTEYLPALKDVILARDGKLVIRPDSGDPVKIMCGDPEAPAGSPERKGVTELQWEVFGGTVTSTGHRMLDPHIGAIYGDGINRERQLGILQGLADKGFASGNVVMGLGSYTYQYVTRDTDGWAMKATAARTKSKGFVEIFKKPVTDNGGKFSAKGLLRVDKVDGKFVLRQGVTPEEERGGCLEPVFKDSKMLRFQNWIDICAIAKEAV